MILKLSLRQRESDRFPEVKLLKDLLELDVKTIFKLGLLWSILNHILLRYI